MTDEGCDVCGEEGQTMVVCQGCENVMCETCKEECPHCEPDPYEKVPGGGPS